jgi:hypothetical protein
MSVEYYHLAPVIMTDAIYEAYGGRIGTSTPQQRVAAYQIAETFMMRELTSFLLPTTVTGTFEYSSWLPKRYQLPFYHLISIDAVTILSQTSLCNCETRRDNACAFIADGKYGYIDVRALTNAYLACGCSLEIPYQVQIAFTAGLPTGVAANDAALHLGLTIAAELSLLEIIDPKGLEGGPGDQGVQEWVSMGYGEKRTPLFDTVFGSSARANRVKKLVQHLTPKTAMKLGW